MRSKAVTERKPTRADLEAANDTTIPDVIGPDLRVLFCGINPSLYSAAIGHHFGRPGNRFWPTLHQAGFTPRQYSPYEDQLLLKLGYGVTNVCDRATARADQLNREDFLTGAQSLKAKVKRYKPQVLAILGIGAYRTAFEAPDAQWKEQPERLGTTRIWILPNTSGLNANFQLPDLIRAFAELRKITD